MNASADQSQVPNTFLNAVELVCVLDRQSTMVDDDIGNLQ